MFLTFQVKYSKEPDNPTKCMFPFISLIFFSFYHSQWIPFLSFFFVNYSFLFRSKCSVMFVLQPAKPGALISGFILRYVIVYNIVDSYW